MGCRFGLVMMMSMFLLASGSSSSEVTTSKHRKCGEIEEYMLVCADFLSGKADNMPQSCCEHVQTLNELVHMCLSPQSVCYCIEDLVSKLSSPFLNSRVNALPKKCKKHLSFPISNRMDCSKVPKRSRGC